MKKRGGEGSWTVGAAVEGGGWIINTLNAGGRAGGDGCEQEEEGCEEGDGEMHFDLARLTA